MASFDITGKLKVKNDKQVVSDKFTKREFVITTEEQYPQFISFQLTQDKCDLLDSYQVGEDIKVSFNMRGREWTAPDGTVKFFNSLEAWRLEKFASAGGNTSAPPQPTNTSHVANQSPVEQEKIITSETNDDLPF